LFFTRNELEDAMFETANLSYGPPTKRLWATCAGFTGQVLLIGFALIAPMIWPQVIPHVANAIAIAPPGPPPGRAPETAKVVPVRGGRASRPTRGIFVPPEVPKTKAVSIIDDPADFAPARGNGDRESVIGGTGIDDNTRLAIAVATQAPQPRPAPPPPHVAPPPTPPRPPAPPRISIVHPASPIHRVEPVYPPLAVTARIQGTVRLLGVLGTDGRIRELQVLSGHPMLVRAALDAVQQWVYAPTLLNGQPVEVQAPIEVNFVLSR
jgi:protein TonB